MSMTPEPKVRTTYVMPASGTLHRCTEYVYLFAPPSSARFEYQSNEGCNIDDVKSRRIGSLESLGVTESTPRCKRCFPTAIQQVAKGDE